MKNKIIVILLSAFTFASCLDMDETLYADMQTSDIYKTEADADASTIGIYANLLSSSIYSLPTMLGNTTSTADTRFVYVVSGGIHTETSHLDDYWSTNYTLIRKANEVIEHLWNSSLSEEVKLPYIAEAMALRAYGYFRILRFWGDAPFRLAERDAWVSTFQITPMAEIYQFLIADLEWALPYIWAPGVKPRGRLDNIGARMILADIYLTCASSARAYNPATSARALKPYYTAFNSLKESYWARVKELTEEVIGSSYYALENDWTRLWGYSTAHDSRANREHIWTSQVVPGVLGSKTMFRYTPTYSEYCPGQTVGELFMTFDWAASFDRNDIRFKEGVIWEYRDKRYAPHTNGKTYVEVWMRNLDDKSQVVAKGTVRTEGQTIWRYNSYMRLQTKKFYDSTYTTTNNAIGPAIQMPYYRMAEAYLFYAEAENELNSCTQDAVDKINTIRRRAGVTEYTAGSFSREKMREKIIDEREWEFAMEGKDVFTIMRCGVLEERCAWKEVAWNGIEGTSENPRPRTADNYWLPYPKAERITNNELKEWVRMDYEK